MESERIYSQEFEEMRSQIEILKGKLEKQAIISDSHIRSSMGAKMSDMTRMIAISIVVGCLSVPYCTFIFYKYGFSLMSIVVTDVMLVVCIALTIWQNMNLKSLDFSQGNLVDVAEKLNKVKTHYSNWTKFIAFPMILAWVLLVVYEVMTNMEPGPMQTGFLVGVAVGVIIGGIIGLKMNRKIIRKSTEILNQIEDLQKTFC